MITDLSTRYITIELVLTNGTFFQTPQGPSNKKIITCNSGQNMTTCEVEIANTIGFQQGTANIVIYGLIDSDVNSFTRANLNTPTQLLANTINIYAGYSIDQNRLPPLAYSGQILTSGPDWNNPSKPFKISSMVGIVTQNTLITATNPKGQISLDSLFSTIVNNAGFTYVPNGVSTTTFVNNPIYIGSFQQQMNDVCSHYNYTYKQDGDFIYVAPLGQPLNAGIYQLNAQNGMLGYPIVEQFGISVRMRYNPAVKFGQIINVTSLVPIANGQNWYINGIQTYLQNQGNRFESVLKLNAFLAQLGITSG